MDFQLHTHCLNCFKPSQSDICPHCEFNREDYLQNKASLNYLKPFTSLGHYVIGRVLGNGGFSMVYTAIRPEDGLRFAIKEYFPQQLANRKLNGREVNPQTPETFNRWHKRFIQEGELLRRCYDHPSIESGVVRYADLLQENNTAYLVMERLQGDSLRNYLQNKQQLSTRQIIMWLKPMLNTLQKLHDKKIFHRDISPNNIFITKAGPILMDFG
jgi:serine/threonine protein kinase